MRALRFVVYAALPLGLASQAPGQSLELEVGNSSALQIKIRSSIVMPIVMPVSIFGPGIPGHAMAEPEFHSAQAPRPAEDFFVLAPFANVRMVLLSKDPGVEVLNDTGSGYLGVGQQYFIGAPPFDSHPIWTIPSATQGELYDMSFKLIDLNGIYTESAPFNLTFTPAAAASQTYYWDVNGATAGAGGSSPAGNWNGVAANFNTNAAGGGGGTFVASPTSADTVVFSAGSDATGSYIVSVSGTRSAGTVKVDEGNVTFTGGTLAVGAFEVSAGASGTLASNIAAPGDALTKSGTGMLHLSKLPQDHAMNVTAGTVRIAESAPGYGTGHPSGDDAQVSQPSSLTIAAGATLDVTNNDVIIDYTGASPVAAYEALVASGYNATGDWAGDGITSSVAAADGNYVVAIADNAALAAPFGTAQGGPLFAGVDVDLTTILVKFTHRADINLDGLVTPDDSAVFGGNYDEGQPAVWATGDMNYDGVFTPDDAAIFGGAYDESLASLPEPTSAPLLVLAAISLRRRRA